MGFVGQLVLVILTGPPFVSALPSNAYVLSQLAARDELGSQESPALLAGDRAFEAADYETAISTYSQISPAELPVYALNRLGIAYHLSDRLRDAEGTYRVATLRYPEVAAAFNNLGAVFYAREDFKDSEKYFKEALKRAPDNELYQQNLRASKYARENGRVVRQVIADRREASPQLVERVRAEGVSVVPLMLEEDQIELADLVARGDAFLVRKLFEDAIIEYERAIEIEPYDAVLMNKLGIAYHQNQDLRSAEKRYRKVVDLNPYYAAAFNNLGSIAQVRGEYPRALDYYRRALEIREPSATVLRNIGACLFAMERYEEGLSVYLQALALDPQLFDREAGFGAIVRTAQGSSAMVNFYMAKLFAQRGDRDRTMSFLYRAVEEGFEDAQMLQDAAFDLLANDERYLQLLVATSGPR